jgi:hypothetical protein
MKERAMKGSLLLAVLLTACGVASAAPWTIVFGSCTFSGDTRGAPLSRTGSCFAQSGKLDLSDKGIMSVPSDAFQGMSQMT